MGFYWRTLPVRRGLILFHKTVSVTVPPPNTNTSNKAAISMALSAIQTEGATNTAAALARARKFLTSSACAIKTVVLISDGEPTRAPGCASQSSCCLVKAMEEAALLRVKAGATLIPLEIRRSNYTSFNTKLLLQMAGQSGTGGGDGKLFFLSTDRAGIDRFLKKMTRRICSIGPLLPAPTAAQNVSVHIHASLPLVSNVDLHPYSPGFEVRKTNTGTFILLTLHSCIELGRDPNKRVIVRWTN